MQHLITIFNPEGIEIGKKQKSEINKKQDIFQAIYVRIFVKDKLSLTKVLKKEGGIEKTNEGKWGLPVATILRDGETADEAFERACLDDIGIIPEITKVYDKRLISFETTPPRIVYEYDAKLESIPISKDKEYMLVEVSVLPEMYKEGTLAETALIFNI